MPKAQRNPQTNVEEATAIFDPEDDITGRLLRGVGKCPECQREDALSEFVVCKGARTIRNKGRLYQFVSLPNQHPNKAAVTI